MKSLKLKSLDQSHYIENSKYKNEENLKLSIAIQLIYLNLTGKTKLAPITKKQGCVKIEHIFDLLKSSMVFNCVK